MGTAITHMFEIDALRRAMMASVFFVLAAQILVAGAVLRHLTRAIAASLALAAAIALAGGLVWLLGKPVIPMTAAMLFLLPALGLSSHHFHGHDARQGAWPSTAPCWSSGVAMIGATLALGALADPGLCGGRTARAVCDPRDAARRPAPGAAARAPRPPDGKFRKPRQVLAGSGQGVEAVNLGFRSMGQAQSLC